MLALAKSCEYHGIVVNSRKLAEAKEISDTIESLCRCDSVAIEADISEENDCIMLMEEL
jgi:hypothetical protein